MTDILPEQLLQCCPNDRLPTEPGVYSLEIDLPDTSKEQLQRDWMVHYDTLPPYFHRLVDCHTAVYVGASANVQSRLADHLDKQVRKASLPTVFTITELRGVDWYDDSQEAFEAEYNAARQIDEATDALTYVHSR